MNSTCIAVTLADDGELVVVDGIARLLALRHQGAVTVSVKMVAE
jgi:hypothetical protein